MNYDVIQTIYEVFADWSSRHLAGVCAAGCSACCTSNVTITAAEGEMILRYVKAENLSSWLVEKLAGPRSHRSARVTTNDFAAACLEGREIDPGENHNRSACPFLEENLCRIYPVRPFGCRLFTSTTRCSTVQPALVPDFYFEGATAASQLLEHLGQKEYWGNMLDVLPTLLDCNEFREMTDGLDSARIVEARFGTLTAKPLPGFLLSEQGHDRVSLLLDAIFSAQVAGQRVEDILNGKQPGG